MFKQTKHIADCWRFDWVNDRGDVFGGLRFYPKTGILTSWSRKAHVLASRSYHPYVINEHDWHYIREACIQRWPNVAEEPKPKVKKLVEMAYYEPAFGNNWVPLELMRRVAGKNFDKWNSSGMLFRTDEVDENAAK